MGDSSSFPGSPDADDGHVPENTERQANTESQAKAYPPSGLDYDVSAKNIGSSSASSNMSMSNSSPNFTEEKEAKYSLNKNIVSDQANELAYSSNYTSNSSSNQSIGTN